MMHDEALLVVRRLNMQHVTTAILLKSAIEGAVWGKKSNRHFNKLLKDLTE